MIIADRLRALRQQKHLSQGQIEKRTGLLRCYLSRVENGHTVPSVATLEKLARALFYDGDEPPSLPNLPRRKSAADILWGSSPKYAPTLAKFCRCLSRTGESERRLLLHMARKMAKR